MESNMLTLVLDEVANEPQDLPAPVIASISAGMPISDQQRKDLTMSDIEKSVTPAPSDSPIFEKGGYLAPQLSRPRSDTPKNDKGQSKALDADTVWYLTRMHKAARSFEKSKQHIADLKKQKHPSVNDLKRTQDNLKTQSLRYANLVSISTTRLAERSANLDPNLLREVNKDTSALNTKMDSQFKSSIRSGDLELPRMEVGRLGLYMDQASNNIKAITDNTLDAVSNNAKTALKQDNSLPASSM